MKGYTKIPFGKKPETEVYPLTIVKDRYNGKYSGGVYTAWKLNRNDIPEEVYSNETIASKFWKMMLGYIGENRIFVGFGNTPDEALKDLIDKIEKHESK